MTVSLTGYGRYVPDGTITGAEIADRSGIPEEVVIEKMGVVEKHVCPPDDDHVTDMGVAAARDALADAGRDAADVDLVLYHGSEYKDYYVWSAAADIAERLGAENAYAAENYALCAGQPLAFRQVAAQIAAGDIDTAVLVGASREEDLVDYTDTDASFMFNFGSGACATVLERGDSERALATLQGHAAETDGSFSRDVIMPAGGSERPPSENTVAEGQHTLTVPDPEGMKERLADVSLPNFLGVADDALAAAELSREAVDFVALTHMKRSFHEHLVGELGVGDGHHYLDHYGHVQSVDQVLALDEGLEKGLIDDGDVVLFLAAGTGYTWAASVLRWVD
ncbi:MAG: 3-oxoacyl-ACP synthase [Halolamina sp.]